jgi:cytochrome c6
MRHTIRIGSLSGVLLLLQIPALKAQNDAAGLYKSKCAACHGADGKGNTPVAQKLGVRDFASLEVQKETDAELLTILAKGKNKMPGYEKQLSQSEIKDQVAYIRELAREK